jgi:DNA-binding Xre family transcriptional regulator
MTNPHAGSDFDDFLREEGIFEEVQAAAIKKVVAAMVERAMSESAISKTEMANRMATSRAQLDRLLDPSNSSITLATIARAATAVGKRVSISFEDVRPAKLRSRRTCGHRRKPAAALNDRFGR